MRNTNLLSEEWHNSGWPSISQTAGCSASPSMVNYGGNVLEEPLVWTVTDPVYIWVIGARKIRPALKYDGANPDGLYGV